ncbi:MAG TPA: site-2 protease family protein [Bryobacteraceae bacterium]|nr:site-2 protease family protein [Bryobacteraceae bacterium]
MDITPEMLRALPIWYVAFLLSLTCHEGAHALAAKLGGDPTAFEAGQVSLNPLPHIRRELFGTVLFPLITYIANGWMMGWASAPFDPRWERRYPRRASAMALAGPAANFILATLAALAMRVGLLTHGFVVPETIHLAGLVQGQGMMEGLATFVSVLFSLNVLLGVFNLLPIPPLDGSSAIAFFMPERVALRYIDMTRSRMLAIVGLVIAWQLFNPMFRPVFGYALRALYAGLRLT